jgi:hypothetical protein
MEERDERFNKYAMQAAGIFNKEVSQDLHRVLICDIADISKAFWYSHFHTSFTLSALSFVCTLHRMLQATEISTEPERHA